MKKFLVIYVAVVLMAISSCKQNNFKDREYGTVVFDLTGGSNLRFVNPSTGLPELSHSKMKIIVEKDGQRVEVKEFGERDKKQYKGSFLVGSKLKITAITVTNGGKWKGSDEITVAGGINTLNIKLKKAVFGLVPLKFQFYEDKNVQGVMEKKFRLGFNGEYPFFDEEIDSDEYKYKAPSFCRDQKGRTYVFYKDKDQKAHLVRYTSDGYKDFSFAYEDNNAIQKKDFVVVSDQKTGNIFVSFFEYGSAEYKFFVVEEESSVVLKDISSSDRIGDMSVLDVHDGVFFTIGFDIGKWKVSLYKYNANSRNISKIGEKELGGEILDIKIKENTSGKSIRYGRFVDSFMNDKAIYLLYNLSKEEGYSVSAGGIYKFSYNIESDRVTIQEPKRLIAKEEYNSVNNIVNIKDERKELYGPLRFVGFDEDVLYIADDGTVREYEAGAAQVLENKNRIVSFNTAKDEMFIEREYDNLETWNIEQKPVSKTSGTLFFSRKDGYNEVNAEIRIHNGKEFFNFENNHPFATVVNTGAFIKYTFDSSGNLYVAHRNSGNHDVLSKYSPCKTKNGIVYEHSEIRLDSNRGMKALYYDDVKKDLYRIVRDNSTQEDDLYKRRGNTWTKIERGSYEFSALMAISDGKLYSYKEDTFSIEVKDLNDLNASANTINMKGDMSESLKVLGFFINKDDLYFLYKKTPSVRAEVFALALKKDGSNIKKLDEPLFRLETDVSNMRPISFGKEMSELRLLLDSCEQDYDGRPVGKNINKYISLDYNTSSLVANKKELPANGITWYVEAPLWKGTKDIMLWKNDINIKETEYYKFHENTPLDASLKGKANSYKVCDSFCYDQFGNLYVLIEKGGKFYVVRFELQENGEYEFGVLKDKINDGFDDWKEKVEVNTSSVSVVNKDFVMAAYLDSSTNETTLYYRRFENSDNIDIYKCEFYNGEFNTPSPWLSNVSIDDSAKKIAREFTSIAANKDGVFIAEKELEYVGNLSIGRHKSYKISLIKYPHKNPNYGSPLGKIDVLGSASNRLPTKMFKKYENAPTLFGANDALWNNYTKEDITDMCAYNGVLYAVSYKREGGMDIPIADGVGVFEKTMSSGAILKIANTKDFSGNAERVCTSESINASPIAKFSPCHIIGILPKKIVIASDGFHGYNIEDVGGQHNNCRQGDNYDRVYFLNTESSKLESEEGKEAKTKFNFQLRHYKDAELFQTTCAFEWE